MFFDRLETQLKQILREAEIKEGIRPVIPIAIAVNMLMATTEGRIMQFVRSEFKRKPTENWREQWSVLVDGFYKETFSATQDRQLFENALEPE